MERAPEKVSKILDIALTKSIKEHEGIASKSPSQPATPGMRPAQLTTTSQSAATPTTTPQISNLQSLPVKPPISTPLPQVPQQQVSGVNIPGPIATPNIGVTSGVGNLGTTSIGTPTPTQIQSPATSVIPAMQLPQNLYQHQYQHLYQYHYRYLQLPWQDLHCLGNHQAPVVRYLVLKHLENHQVLVVHCLVHLHFIQ